MRTGIENGHRNVVPNMEPETDPWELLGRAREPAA